MIRQFFQWLWHGGWPRGDQNQRQDESESFWDEVQEMLEMLVSYLSYPQAWVSLALGIMIGHQVVKMSKLAFLH